MGDVFEPTRAIRPRSAPAVLLLVTAVAAALPASGCKKADAAKGPAAGPQVVPVDVAVVRTDSVQRTVEVVGTLFGEEDATISNKVNGKIIAIYHDVGDRVGPGEPLAQLLKNDYLLDLNQKRAALLETLAKLGLSELPPENFDLATMPTVRRARLQLVNAEAKYHRGEQLHAQRPPLVSDQDFEDLRTAVDVARSAFDAEVLAAKALLAEARTKHAELLVAEQALRDTTVRAPSTTYAPPEFNRPLSAMSNAGGAGGTEDADRTAAGPSTQLPSTHPTTLPTTGPVGAAAALVDTVAASSATQPVPLPATRPADVAAEAAAGGASTRSYVVAARFGSVGELERAVTPLFRLVDDDPLKLRAAVPERYFREVAVGQKVRGTVAAAEPDGKPLEFKGTVSRINPQVDPANRTFPIEVLVPNPDHALAPGSFANASIETRLQAGVVFAPWSAVVSYAGNNKVYVLEPDPKDKGTIRAREVEVGLGNRRGDDVEVRTGLAGGETVATGGTSRLATGAAVSVKK